MNDFKTIRHSNAQKGKEKKMNIIQDEINKYCKIQFENLCLLKITTGNRFISSLETLLLKKELEKLDRIGAYFFATNNYLKRKGIPMRRKAGFRKSVRNHRKVLRNYIKAMRTERRKGKR